MRQIEGFDYEGLGVSLPIWQLIAALDSGRSNSLSFSEVGRHADAGPFSAVNDRIGGDANFGFFEPKDSADVNEAWSSIANAVDARRKFGVENKGIALLMAYTLQSIQQLRI